MLEAELEKKTGPDPPGGRPGSGSGVRKAKPLVRASSMDRPSGLSEGKERTFRNLEKKNKQLNSATKQLEEKVKNLAQKSTANAPKPSRREPPTAVRALPKMASKVRPPISIIIIV